jgi:hypothetical protein
MCKPQSTRKSASWFVLLVCCSAMLVHPTAAATTEFAADAEGLATSTAGPIARAIEREAVRLSLDSQAESSDVRWLRVRKLAPGAEIIVTVEGAQPGGRYVVRADESDLTVLNVADPQLPTAVKGVLRDAASNHPEYFSSAQQGGTVVLEKRLRLQRDGVFIGGRKVVELGQIVETIAREDVTQITRRRKGRGAWGHLGPLGGYFVGAMSGGVVAGLGCQAAIGRDRCDTGAFLTGMLIGGIAGGTYGFHAANRVTEDLVYRAP